MICTELFEVTVLWWHLIIFVLLGLYVYYSIK